MNLATRMANNGFTLLVIGGFFYFIYLNIKNPKFKDKIKDFFEGGINE